ncbi:PqqD family peptide modification chaperone [Baia soyae]|uniref:Coenzyme PQQ synthesis protein D (PqqD) n=1 Tax=Baia soyae TaxID=1544746 RepID=A0A4R2S2K5_9BACL|nr:PqqD family peptide modification chaperone [Baia soyae]TCP65545.1 coenzyme PQQ synthesis protein D (PqqD) [Baia soyae]
MQFSIPEHIHLTEIEGRWVLLDCLTNRFFAINKTGAEFLEQVNLCGEVELAIQYISKTYEIPFERAKYDMKHFVRSLSERELVFEI